MGNILEKREVLQEELKQLSEFTYTSEVRPYHKRAVLVFGGARDIGREAVARMRELGVKNIFIGTRNEEHFTKALNYFSLNKKLNTNNIHIFRADVTDRSQLEDAVYKVKKNGIRITDVIFSHAGGMEVFSRLLIEDYLLPINGLLQGKSLHEVDICTKKHIQQKLVELNERLDNEWLPQAMPHGIAVNFQGTVNAIEVLRDAFPQGYVGIFLNSAWGDLFGERGVDVPKIYTPVGQSKALARDWLESERKALENCNIYIGTVVASLVRKTQVGKFLEYLIVPLLPPEQQSVILSSSVSMADVVRGAHMFLDNKPQVWPTKKIYVKRENQRAVYSALNNIFKDLFTTISL